jgi:hypothetical protein
MKNMLSILFFIYVMSVSAQSGKRDTVKLDSTQVEKIRKMPMDTMIHTMPVVPLTPPKNSKNKKDNPIHLSLLYFVRKDIIIRNYF